VSFPAALTCCVFLQQTVSYCFSPARFKIYIGKASLNLLNINVIISVSLAELPKTSGTGGMDRINQFSAVTGISELK